MLFYILVGLVLGAITSSGAGAITLSEVEQKLISLEQKFGALEQNVTTMEKDVGTLKHNQSNSETKISGIQNQLKYGGKKYPVLWHTNSKYSYSYVVAVVAIVNYKILLSN